MLTTVKKLPLLLHVFVFGKFRIALGPAIAVFYIYRQQVGKQKCVHSLALVFGFYGHEKQVYYIIGAVERLKQMGVGVLRIAL